MIGQYVNVSLNGELYNLAREDISSRIIGSKRIWNVELKPKAVKIVDREDILSGVLADEFVVNYDDFSQGMCGYHRHIPGRCHAAHARIEPGIVRNIGDVATANLTSGTGVLVGDMKDLPTVLIEFNGNVYVLSGKYIHRLAYGTATAISESTLNTFTVISDAIAWEGAMYIAQCNGTLNTIAKMDTAEAVSDTMVGANVYANFFAIAGNHLWKAYDGKICSLDPGDNPMDASKWGPELEVGDQDKKITGLVALGEKIYVCKEDGLFVGAEDTSFTNVLPQFETIPNYVNGRGAKVFGTSIFYPHADGLIRYEPGAVIECGLQEEVPTVEKAGTSYYNGGSAPSNKIRAMCSDNRGIWVATYPSFQLAVYPKKVLFNQTGGITDVTSTVCNGSSATGAIPDVTTADYVTILAVGHTSKFFGIYFEIKTPDTKGCQLEHLHYNTAGGWADFTAGADSGNVIPVDGTDRNGMFTKSGWVRWRTVVPNWGVLAVSGWGNDADLCYWMGLLVDKGLTGSLTCSISEVMVAVDAVDSHILRVLPANNNYGIRWNPFTAPQSEAVGSLGEVGALLVTTRGSGGGEVSPMLIEATPTQVRFRRIGGSDVPFNYIDSYVVTGMDNMGINEPKRIIDAYVDFRTMGFAGNGYTHGPTVSLYYRADGGAWTAFGSYTMQSGLIASGTITPTTPITATNIQWMICLSDVTGAGDLTGDYLSPTELYSVSVRYKVARGASDFKREYTFYLEVGDGQYSKGGAPLPDGSVQLTNLEALIGAGQITLIDPMGGSKTVTVDNIVQSELLQDGTDYPRLLIEVTASEV